MKERIIGAILVIAYAFLLLKSEGIIYLSLILALGLEIIGELLEIIGLENHKTIPYTIFGLSTILFYNMEHRVILIPLIILSMFTYFVIMEKIESKKFYPLTLFFLYVLTGIGSITLFDKRLLILLLSLVWSVDTLAYLTGKYFGKHKLIPLLSPKKTIEGAIGGTIGGTLITVFVGTKLNLFSISFNTVFLILFLTIISQLGDLMESFLKRQFNVKDSGNLIPGHGGVFDRLDSSIAVAPFLLLFVSKINLL